MVNDKVAINHADQPQEYISTREYKTEMNFDASSRGSAPVDYLEAAARTLSTLKERSYELLRLSPGAKVIDIGCGPGLDTVKLVPLVGSDGLVVGVDQDWPTIMTAHRRSADSDSRGSVHYSSADGHCLPFREGQFDAARCDRVLMHIQDPLPVIAEMARVLKPGGRIALTEPDWGTLSISSSLTPIERRLAQIRADRTLSNGYVGRTLYQLLQEVGCGDLSVEVAAVWSTRLAEIRYLTFLDRVEADAVKLGMLSEHDVALWRQDLERLDRSGHCFAQMNVITTAATKTAV